MPRKRSRGRSSRGGRAKSVSIFDQLSSDTESVKKKKNHASVEEPVDYNHQKLNHLTKCVDELATNSGRRDDFEPDESSSHEHEETAPRKKRKEMDESEEKLDVTEARHVKKRNTEILNYSSGSSSLESARISISSSSEEDELAPDDAVYDEKFEPRFDLMNSILRDSYKKKSKGLGKVREDGEGVEFEITNNKIANLGDGQSKIDNSDKDNNGIERWIFKDLGGMDALIKELIRKVIVPFFHPQIEHILGVKPVSGILLHGPPGCGKTKLANAIANETGVPFYKVSATQFISGVSGESEENIRDLFSKAQSTAPSIIFIDEIDAIASKREISQKGMENRVVTQLITCMSESSVLTSSRPGSVLVIGATNRPDAIDPALRRPGRFDREFVLGVPDESARVKILSVLKSKFKKVEDSFDLLKIARFTPGYVGADLEALMNEAGLIAAVRAMDHRPGACEEEQSEGWWKSPLSHEEIKSMSIVMADAEEASKIVQPSSKREGFSTIPNVKWEDVGGLHSIRQEFERCIIRRIKYPEMYKACGLNFETGFLLHGPPGCGKTLIAKAVANEAGANFIHIKGPELLSKFVGESESEVRKIFRRARTCSPCIIFFDEVDALTMERGSDGGSVVDRVVAQLLVELDGAEERRGVYVIGATNRLEVIDDAVLRHGRFGKHLYVPLPSPEERGMILKALARGMPIDDSVDLMDIAKDKACDNFSGADLSALINEAVLTAMEEQLDSFDTSSVVKKFTIKGPHFKIAKEKISPSVSAKATQKQSFRHLAAL